MKWPMSVFAVFLAGLANLAVADEVALYFEGKMSVTDSALRRMIGKTLRYEGKIIFDDEATPWASGVLPPLGIQAFANYEYERLWLSMSDGFIFIDKQVIHADPPLYSFSIYDLPSSSEGEGDNIIFGAGQIGAPLGTVVIKNRRFDVALGIGAGGPKTAFSGTGADKALLFNASALDVKFVSLDLRLRGKTYPFWPDSTSRLVDYDADFDLDTDVPSPPASGFLAFPLDCSAPVCADGFAYSQGAYTPSSVTSVLDHQMEYIYVPDGVVLAWTGEEGKSDKPRDGGCYPNVLEGQPFSIDGTYVGTNDGCLADQGLNYDGHPGFDYLASLGTPVKAAAAGTVVNNGQKCIPKGLKEGCDAWGAVGIDHGNGYVTQYMHLSEVLVDAGQSISKGELIGKSGKKSPPSKPVGLHLHFEVLKQKPGTSGDSVNDFKIVDPYGWFGDGPDPLQGVTEIQNVLLWE